MNGIATLKYAGLFLPCDQSETLVVFNNTFAAADEDGDVYYAQAALEEAAKNYDAHGNQVQAEELIKGLRALTEFRTNHAYNH